jgi:hypothetical protein
MMKAKEAAKKGYKGRGPDGVFMAAFGTVDQNPLSSERSLKLRQAVSKPTRGSAHKITHDGITDSWAGWARRLDVSVQTLYARRRAAGGKDDPATLAKILVPLEKPGATRKKFVFDAPPPLPSRKR